MPTLSESPYLRCLCGGILVQRFVAVLDPDRVEINTVCSSVTCRRRMVVAIYTDSEPRSIELRAERCRVPRKRR